MAFYGVALSWPFIHGVSKRKFIRDLEHVIIEEVKLYLWVLLYSLSSISILFLFIRD